MKAWRSRVNASARRKSELSKGGAARLTIRVRGIFHGTTSQIACGAWFWICFISGIDRMPTANRSKFPAAKAMIAVDGFLMIVNSMPSR